MRFRGNNKKCPNRPTTLKRIHSRKLVETWEPGSLSNPISSFFCCNCLAGLTLQELLQSNNCRPSLGQTIQTLLVWKEGAWGLRMAHQPEREREGVGPSLQGWERRLIVAYGQIMLHVWGERQNLWCGLEDIIFPSWIFCWHRECVPVESVCYRGRVNPTMAYIPESTVDVSISLCIYKKMTSWVMVLFGILNVPEKHSKCLLFTDWSQRNSHKLHLQQSTQ